MKITETAIMMMPNTMRAAGAPVVTSMVMVKIRLKNAAASLLVHTFAGVCNRNYEMLVLYLRVYAEKTAVFHCGYGILRKVHDYLLKKRHIKHQVRRLVEQLKLKVNFCFVKFRLHKFH